MITNFEIITAELTEDEKEMIPYLIKGFQTHGKENPVTAPEIVKTFNNFLQGKEIKYKLTEVKLRKMVNFIRSNSVLPLIATSAGYFVTNDETEIRLQIRSLEERAKSIKDAANGLYQFVKTKGNTP
jgi:hypothetical protein